MFQKVLQLVIWKNTGLKGVVKFFLLILILLIQILDIHKYLMKKTWHKIMFGLIKKTFIGFLTSLLNGWNHSKCVLLRN